MLHLQSGEIYLAPAGQKQGREHTETKRGLGMQPFNAPADVGEEEGSAQGNPLLCVFLWSVLCSGVEKAGRH